MPLVEAPDLQLEPIGAAPIRLESTPEERSECFSERVWNAPHRPAVSVRGRCHKKRATEVRGTGRAPESAESGGVAGAGCQECDDVAEAVTCGVRRDSLSDHIVRPPGRIEPGVVPADRLARKQ